MIDGCGRDCLNTKGWTLNSEVHGDVLIRPPRLGELDFKPSSS
jgi:hypothetical protein